MLLAFPASCAKSTWLSLSTKHLNKSGLKENHLLLCLRLHNIISQLNYCNKIVFISKEVWNTMVEIFSLSYTKGVTFNGEWL